MAKKCKKHDPVKLITKVHGDVWICLECKSIDRQGIFTEEEIDALVKFAKFIRDRKKEK